MATAVAAARSKEGAPTAATDYDGSSAARPVAGTSVAWKVVAGVTGAAIVLTPVVFDWGGHDVFRLPKVLLLRLAAILALFGFVAFARRAEYTLLWRSHRTVVALAAALVAWSAISATLATRPWTAWNAVITIAAGAIFAVAAASTARVAGLLMLDALMLPALANSVVFLAQRFGGWDPFNAPEYLGRIALLGNPNDVGAYLVGPALASIATVLCAHGVRRIAYLPVAMLFTGALLASRAKTALAAFLVALAVMIIARWGKRGSVAVAAIGALLITGVSLSPLRDRIVSSEAVRSWEGLNVAMTGRMNAFAAAWQMFLDRPLLGVGPGGFAPHYFEYRLRADRDYGHLTPFRLESLGYPMNFGETHNDHLQTLAELGIVGYALWAGALLYVASRSLRTQGQSTRARVGRVLAAPLSAALAVTALAAFPMQIAAPAATFIALGAFCAASTRDSNAVE